LLHLVGDLFELMVVIFDPKCCIYQEATIEILTSLKISNVIFDLHSLNVLQTTLRKR